MPLLFAPAAALALTGSVGRAFAVLLNIPTLFCLAQLLVICSSVIQTLDLVITAGRLQMFMQATYAIAYVVLAVPMTIVWGLEGFVVASCLAAALRYAVAFLVGYRNIPKKVEA